MISGNRRKNLIESMNSLEQQGISCIGCAGKCCTFEANSMLITPLEALEIMLHLKSSRTLTPELKQHCISTIDKYRLKVILGNGKKTMVRRTYTCPLFNHSELGCPLPKTIKPYGCLAFNSHHAELKADEHCYSETELLKAREEEFIGEADKNEKLKERFKLSWNKTSIPEAILDFWDLEFSDDDLLSN